MKEKVGFIKNGAMTMKKRFLFPWEFVLLLKLLKFKKRIDNSNDFMSDLFRYWFRFDLNTIKRVENSNVHRISKTIQ